MEDPSPSFRVTRSSRAMSGHRHRLDLAPGVARVAEALDVGDLTGG